MISVLKPPQERCIFRLCFVDFSHKVFSLLCFYHLHRICLLALSSDAALLSGEFCTRRNVIMMCFHVRVWTGSLTSTRGPGSCHCNRNTFRRFIVRRRGAFCSLEEEGGGVEAAGVGVFRVNVNKTSRALHR